MTDADTATEFKPDSEPRASRNASSASPGDDRDDGQVADDYEQAMTRLHKMSAPHSFADEVEDTIRRRSAGRFFGRKAFGDRVPFEVLAIVVLVIGLAVFYLIRSSQTGSLRYEDEPRAPEIAPGARDVVPRLSPVDK